MTTLTDVKLFATAHARQFPQRCQSVNVLKPAGGDRQMAIGKQGHVVRYSIELHAGPSKGSVYPVNAHISTVD